MAGKKIAGGNSTVTTLDLDTNKVWQSHTHTTSYYSPLEDYKEKYEKLEKEAEHLKFLLMLSKGLNASLEEDIKNTKEEVTLVNEKLNRVLALLEKQEE